MASKTSVDYRRCYRTYGIGLILGQLLLFWDAYIWAGFTAVVLIGMVLVAVGHVAARINGQSNPEIAQRADEQNAAVERGEARGIYGDYPPAKILDPVIKRALEKDWSWGLINGERVMFIHRRKAS